MSFTFQNPFAYVANPTKSAAVGLGKLYIGLPDTDPVDMLNPANQIPVYAVQPDGSELAIPQPVRMTAGGVLTYGGTPIQLKVDAELYAVRIDSSANAQLYYTPRVELSGGVPDGVVLSINSIKFLEGVEEPVVDTVYQVIGFYEDTTVGGGGFVWEPTRPYSDHNGGTVIAPPAIAAWDGAQADIATFLNWTGSGVGCWVRTDNQIDDFIFGAINGANNRNSIIAAAKSAVGSTTKIRAISVIQEIIPLPSNSDIVFDGGEINNDGTISTLKSAVFMAGHFHPTMYGVKPIGSPDPYTRQVDRYLCSSAVTNGSLSVTMASPANASNFVSGGLYFIASQESSPQTSTGVDIDFPNYCGVVKCKSSNSTTGVVEFYEMVGFTTATPPYLCKLIDGETDQGLPIYIAENISITNAKGSGRSILGFTTVCYNFRLDNWSGHYSYIIQLNGLINAEVSGFIGTFENSALEIKFCTNNAQVHSLIGHCTTDGVSSPIGLISYGEACRNLSIYNFKLFAPLYDPASNPLLQLQPGINCNIYDGFIFAPLSQRQPVQFYSDGRIELENCSVDDVEIYSASPLGIRMGGSYASQTPRNCRATNIRLYTSYAGAAQKILISMENSTNCEISSCQSPNLQVIQVTSGSVLPRVRRNGTAAGGSLSGANSGLLGVNENYIGDNTSFLPLGTNKFNRSSFGTDAAPQASIEASGAARFLGVDSPISGAGTEAGYDPANGGYISARDRGAATYERMTVTGSEVDVRINADSILRFRRHGSPNRADFIVSDAEPEGVITAPVNSLCISSVSGAAKIWQKAGGGTSNTGWVEK